MVVSKWGEEVFYPHIHHRTIVALRGARSLECDEIRYDTSKKGKGTN